ncbi:MAG: TonB-dependent outer rane receptor, partial [Mucilaginibacter sp.]|nr:TonB-dependent outer rane receptor [Mucilaginibacter sp.]
MKKLLCNFFMVWFVALNCYAQDHTIRGKVTDENGGAMPGVSVTLKGTQRGSVTNPNGNFSIDASGTQGNTLVITFI